MSDTTASLRRKIRGAGDPQSVVRMRKAPAASSDEKPPDKVCLLKPFLLSNY